MHFFILRTPLRFGENTLKKLITKLCIIAAQDQRFARYAARKASIFPNHPSVVQKIKNMSLFVYHVLAVYDFHFRSIPFQELRSFLTLALDTALHFIPIIHFSTPRLRDTGSRLFACIGRLIPL